MSTQDNRKGNEYPQNELPVLYKATDVARTLGIAVKTVNKLVREKKLGCVQTTARDRRFTTDQIHAYIEAQSRKPEEVRIDTPHVRQVSSPPKKGGERSFGVSRADLRKEMRLWQ
jgi:excisionase family DNA binding protein